MYKKFINTVLLLFLVLFIGTAGYMLIEQWQFLDALFMTVITLATVGYGEVHALSDPGRIFSIFLILTGMSILLYSVSAITSFFIEGELSQFFRRKKMIKKISQLKEHYIVCGAGRTGVNIISELAKTRRDFVIIDTDKRQLEKYGDSLYVEGDSTDEEILNAAGIEHAAGLFAVLPSDEGNLFLIITAKGLNRNIKIIAKCETAQSAKKLLAAGAISVVRPNLIGGMRMVSEMIRPKVVSFLDKMLKQDRGDLRVEEVRVRKGFSGSISDIPIEKSGALLLAVVSLNKYKFNPPKSLSLVTGDILIVMGNCEQVAALQSMI